MPVPVAGVPTVVVTRTEITATLVTEALVATVPVGFKVPLFLFQA